jgi:hypothetical protein
MLLQPFMRSEPTLDARGLWSPFLVSGASNTGRRALPETRSSSLTSHRDNAAARAARVAENEATFRRANEHLEVRFRELGAEGLTPFLCECGDAGCTRTIRLLLDEYEAVRTHPAHFAIVRGHQILEAERVVEQNDRYDVVEKVDVGRRVAEARDPR